MFTGMVALPGQEIFWGWAGVIKYIDSKLLVWGQIIYLTAVSTACFVFSGGAFQVPRAARGI